MPTDSLGLTLHIERALRAPRPLVYRANTEPEELARWWGPRGFSAPRVEIDLRVGGRYRIAMQPPEGDLFHLSGEFREVEPGVRLAYTFRWEEPTADDRETVVALSFEDMGGGASRLTVDQGDFATEERRSLHLQGWTETLDRLEEVVSGPEALGGD